MVKAARVDENGVRKGAWSEEEDNKLRAYVLRYGHWNWRLLPKYAGLERCGKSCRLRWMNYLKPGVRRGNYTKEERDLIIKLHDELGNKWSAIAAKLPGRSDNDVKNYWHAHINKRSRSRASMQSCKQAPETSMEEKPSEKIHNLDEKSLDLHILESLSSSNSDVNWDDQDSSMSGERNCLGMLSRSGSLRLNRETYDDSATSSDPFSVLIQDNFWTEPFVLDTSDSLDFSFWGLDDEGGVFSPELTSYYNDINLS